MAEVAERVPTPSAGGTRGFWPLRDLPVVGWFLGIIVVSLAHPVIPSPRWLLLHLLVLGAVGHSILVWSRYFADTLLKLPPTPRRDQARRLGLFNLGAVAVVVGVPTSWWWLVVAGASAAVLAVLWHVGTLVRGRTSASNRFSGTLWFYVAAGALLTVGVVLGAWLARDDSEPLHTRLRTAHIAVNMLGWIGLTVLGTVVSLGPTMLRTRIVARAERWARRALPVLVLGIAGLVTAALVDQLWWAVAGTAAYTVGSVLVFWPLARAAWHKGPHSFPTWSLGSGLLWFAGTLLVLTIRGGELAIDHDSGPAAWAAWGALLEEVAPALAAGFVAQVLLGALSYLIPVMMGGGPAAVRSMNRDLDLAGPLRVTLANGCLLAWVSVDSSVARVVLSSVGLLTFASFVPILVRAIKRHRTGATDGEDRTPGQNRALVAIGVGLLLFCASVATAVDPSVVDPSGSAANGVVATGKTVRVEVQARDMRFTPDRVEVTAGDRLVIEVRNTDPDQVHDLVLESGQDSGRLAPGASATIDVGVVGRNLDGWCSVIGHRQRGMVFAVEVKGGDQSATSSTSEAPVQTDGDHDSMGHDNGDPEATPDPDAILDPHLPGAPAGTVHRYTFRVTEEEREVAPGRTRTVWTYQGRAPGPTLRGRVGDTFVIRLVNDGTIGHSIDFHAGMRAPDKVMRTIAPGKSLTYRFTATRAGIWMYHCSSMPMSGHIAAGLFGAVVIDPPGLRPVDQEFVLTQSEQYGSGTDPVDMDALDAEKPDAVVFNGYRDGYLHHPLEVKVGERVRIWLLNAGPNRPLAFHVVGGQFDTVFSEGAWTLGSVRGSARDHGSQTLGLLPSQGGFVEMVFDEPGRYPLVNHVMVDAERGAYGIIEVTD